MAIVIKIEGDTKQLDEALTKSAGKAKAEFEKTGIGDAVKKEEKKATDAFSQIEKSATKAGKGVVDAFSPGNQRVIDDMRSRMGRLGEQIEDLGKKRKHVDDLNRSLDAMPRSAAKVGSAIQDTTIKTDKLLVALKGLNSPLAGVFRSLDDVNDIAGVFGLSMTGGAVAAGVLGGAVVLAAAGIVKLGFEGAKLADDMLKTAAATGKTFEEIQRLEKGGRDLTPQLESLGAVLDADVIRRASEATDQFAILGKQWDTVTIRLAAELKDGFSDLGKAMQDLLRDATPALVGLAGIVGDVFTRIGNEIQKARVDIAGLLGVLSRISTFTVDLPFTDSLHFDLNQGAPDPTRNRSQHSEAALFDALIGGRPLSVSRGLLPAPFNPNAVRRGAGGGGRGSVGALADREQLPESTKQELERLDFAFSLLGKNLNDLADLQAKNTQALALSQSKQVVLEQAGLQATQEFLRVRQQTVQLENRNLELLGAKLRTIEEGGLFNVKLPLGAAPPLGGPGLFVPGVSQDQAFAPIRAANEQQLLARANQSMLDEMAQQYERWSDNVTGILEQTFSDGFRRGPGNFFTKVIDSLKDTIRQILLSQLSQRISGAISPALFNIFGGGQQQGGGGFFGGGNSGGGGGFGGFLGGLFGGGSTGGGLGGLFRTAPFNPNAGIGIPGSISAGAGQLGVLGGLGGSPGGILGGAIGGGGAGGIFGGGGLGALLGGLGPLAPLLGIGIGSSLGGKSTGGKIAGGIGGAIIGANVAFGLGAGLGLSTAAIALLSNPFTIIAGVGLLVGAVLLGKAKQRKSDEKAADEIWVHEMNEVRRLISQVNSDRIDGQEALIIQQQLRAETIAGISQIKTKSVRESRLTNQLRDLDNGVVKELRSAVERQAQRQRIGPLLVPEFAFGGRVPGIDRGYDSVLARLRPDEAVINKQQIALLGGPRALRDAGVPGYEQGRAPTLTPSQTPSSSGPMVIIFEGVTIDSKGIFIEGARTSEGRRVVVQVNNRAKLYGRA